MFEDAVGVGGSLVLWDGASKRSTWTNDLDEAASKAEVIAAKSDCYYGVCLQNSDAALEERAKKTGGGDPRDKSGLAFTRGYSHTVSYVPGIWLDLDIAGSGHEKKGLPENEEDAKAILQTLPIQPSWTIETGGGWHLYWKFEEALELTNASEVESAAKLIRGWQDYIIARAKHLGFTVDATHDLARVLRPAGSINRKYARLVKTLTDYDSAPLHNPCDFEEWVVEPSGPAQSATRSKRYARSDVEEMVQRIEPFLTPDAAPHSAKLMGMLNLQPQFASTWRRERDKEFPSQSEYDMSLASMAAFANWKDEEIATLCIAHRREGGQQLKLDRPDYYAYLVLKARERNDSEQAHERIEDRVEAIDRGHSNPENERDAIMGDLSAVLGFEITKIIRFVSNPPQYRLILPEGSINLGSVNAILNPALFRSSIAAVSGKLIPRFKANRWDPLAQAILQSVEDQHLGADSSEEGVVKEWTNEYLGVHKPSIDRSDAIILKEPFLYQDTAVFFLASFRRWLYLERDERLSRVQVATMLRSANVEPAVVAYTDSETGKRSTVNVWSLPKYEGSQARDHQTEAEFTDELNRGYAQDRM
jgi:hypothetical protein